MNLKDFLAMSSWIWNTTRLKMVAVCILYSTRRKGSESGGAFSERAGEPKKEHGS